MSSLGKFLLAAGALAAPAPLTAAVMVIGNSSARLCYEAAETRPSPDAGDFAHCDAALSRENLTKRNRVATLVNRGVLSLKLRHYEAALADFDKALELDPAQAEASLNKGTTMLRLPGGAERALPLFSAAIANRTTQPAIAYYGRGVANEMAGNLKAAYRDYRMASRLDPRWRDPQIQLSRFAVKPSS